MTLEIVLIAAVSHNGVIGKDGKIPWNIKEDLQRFKALTSGHPIIAGRRTYESFPTRLRPLSNRINYVLTRQIWYAAEGQGTGIIFPVVSLEAALYCAEKGIPKVGNIDYNAVFVIGGQGVYEKALPRAQRLEITHVDQDIEGEVSSLAFFPKIDPNQWRETKREQKEGHAFVTYGRT